MTPYTMYPAAAVDRAVIIALHAREHVGFIQEGTYRDGFRNPENGRFENLCPYGLLAGEYHPS